MIDYNEMVKKVEKDHKIKFRGYGRTKKQNDKCEGAYLDFWHEILDHHDINNPCEVEIDFVRILRGSKQIPEECKSEIKNSLGEAANDYIEELESDLKAKNDISWKLDIISKINESFPDAISADMRLKVFIEW